MSRTDWNDELDILSSENVSFAVEDAGPWFAFWRSIDRHDHSGFCHHAVAAVRQLDVGLRSAAHQRVERLGAVLWAVRFSFSSA
jgi:hypothetical protein